MEWMRQFTFFYTVLLCEKSFATIATDAHESVKMEKSYNQCLSSVPKATIKQTCFKQLLGSSGSGKIQASS